MAKKVRTPAPPAARRVQAPKKRTGPRHAAAAQPRSRLPLLLAAGGVLAVVAVIALVVVFARGSSTDIDQRVREAGGTYREVEASRNLPPGTSRHVTALPKGFKYNTEPPTSGPHNPVWILWGMYDEPVDRLRSVHNLEHGGIVIQYGPDVPRGTVESLSEFYRDDPNGIVIAPLRSLGNKISLAAWTFDLARLSDRGYEGEGHLAIMPRFDSGVFGSFVDEFRFNGPERLAPEDVEPGE